MVVISGLAFQLFQGLDNDFPIWLKLILGVTLALAIFLLALFIRHYLDRDGSNDN